MTRLPAATTTWFLEVVKGKTPGQRYPVDSGEVILGNAVKGTSGIDLAEQEGTSPRRMAAHQAQIVTESDGLSILDLRSPGGTFVNRERLAHGVKRGLREGDLIQLGPVQLRVTTNSEPSAGPTEPFLFKTRNGFSCRSWDDFLTLSAQKWDDLRDEMTSGRLTGFLTKIHREDLAPDPHRAGTADERLDVWLGNLPTKRPATPELEVHPKRIVVRSTTGGGSTRRKIQISNAGYRLLRVTPHVEPADTTWLLLVGPPQVPILTVDSSELTIEVEIPESLDQTRSATVVLQSNGGTVRIEVRLEPASSSTPLEVADAGSSAIDLGVKSTLARVGSRARFLAGGAIMAAMPLMMRLGDVVIPGSPQRPGLLGASCLLAVFMAGLALVLTVRRGEIRDVPAAMLTGLVFGLMIAAVLIALARVIDGFSAGWVAISMLIWGLFGVALAGLSLWLIPPGSRTGGSAR